jgi:16S rRNA (cytosine967-C5)-methyltransferase
MYLQQHTNTAIKIISGYDGTVPFAAVLKDYFAANKKHGSKDRKAITSFCYSYFRLGKSLPELFDAEKRMMIAILLSDNAEKYSALFNDDEKSIIEKPIAERIKFIQHQHPEFDALQIFPFQQELSNQIESNSFTISHLIQPDVFLRVRPNRMDIVQKGLKQSNIEFETENDCIRVSPLIKIDTAVQINRDAVVQDASSQQVGEFFDQMKFYDTVSVWDCCAASGGKSILAWDRIKMQNVKCKIELTVSDVRESIIANLKKRFTEAGIQNYHSFVGDLTKQYNLSGMRTFDIVICDAPCSGSGTWGRTPEQLIFFHENKIEYYSTLQKNIATAAVKHVKKNAYFLYITCSVFEKENEEVVKHLQEKSNLELIEMKYFKGYDKKADTLFAALFTASKP